MGRIVLLTDISATDEIAAWADFEEMSLKEQVWSGSGTCIGLPVLIPGRYIKITGIDETAIDGSYYLQSVSHSFGSDGYTTNFSLGGKK